LRAIVSFLCARLWKQRKNRKRKILVSSRSIYFNVFTGTSLEKEMEKLMKTVDCKLFDLNPIFASVLLQVKVYLLTVEFDM